MAERWYVVPAAYATRGELGELDEEVEPLVLLFRSASHDWPPARTLPRRVRGRSRR